ncbi:MAG: hypothetical protein MJK04_27215 [Psychrosphaera sp.]|nr:hypothetical protein [Psychrosphaera sp.]
MGKHITVFTEGLDARIAMDAIETLINHKFDEQ